MQKTTVSRTCSRKDHKPCPSCNGEMNRSSKTCMSCSVSARKALARGPAIHLCRCGRKRFRRSSRCRQCYLSENPTRHHGHNTMAGQSRTYKTWSMMLQRCTNPNYDGYPPYGGSGIMVCDRWRKFENFLSDMGDRPVDKTLDRWPNKNGNYELGNCRWATPSEQQNNTRCNVVVEYKNKRLTLKQWSDVLGIEYNALWHKYRRAKTWPPQ